MNQGNIVNIANNTANNTAITIQHQLTQQSQQINNMIIKTEQSKQSLNKANSILKKINIMNTSKPTTTLSK